MLKDYDKNLQSVLIKWQYGRIERRIEDLKNRKLTTQVK